MTRETRKSMTGEETDTIDQAFCEDIVVTSHFSMSSDPADQEPGSSGFKRRHPESLKAIRPIVKKLESSKKEHHPKKQKKGSRTNGILPK